MGGQESQARFLGNSTAAGLCAAVSSGTPGRALRKNRAWHISQDLIQKRHLWSHPSPLDSHFSASWEAVAQKTLQGGRTVRLPSTLPTQVGLLERICIICVLTFTVACASSGSQLHQTCW